MYLSAVLAQRKGHYLSGRGPGFELGQSGSMPTEHREGLGYLEQICSSNPGLESNNGSGTQGADHMSHQN